MQTKMGSLIGVEDPLDEVGLGCKPSICWTASRSRVEAGLGPRFFPIFLSWSVEASVDIDWWEMSCS